MNDWLKMSPGAFSAKPEPLPLDGIVPAEVEQHGAELLPLGEPASLCAYSATHAASGVLATTTIECGPVGTVAACAVCAAFYASMGTPERRWTRDDLAWLAGESAAVLAAEPGDYCVSAGTWIAYAIRLRVHLAQLTEAAADAAGIEL